MGLELAFWICFGIAAYTYVGYPLLLALSCLFKKDRRTLAPFRGTVSIIVAARNEEASLERRLRELLQWLADCGVAGEIVVAMIGDEATVKRYYPEGDTIRFQPANARLQPIMVRKSEFRSVDILGIVVGVYRKL